MIPKITDCQKKKIKYLHLRDPGSIFSPPEYTTRPQQEVPGPL